MSELPVWDVVASNSLQLSAITGRIQIGILPYWLINSDSPLEIALDTKKANLFRIQWHISPHNIPLLISCLLQNVSVSFRLTLSVFLCSVPSFVIRTLNLQFFVCLRNVSGNQQWGIYWSEIMYLKIFIRTTCLVFYFSGHLSLIPASINLDKTNCAHCLFIPVKYTTSV